MGSEDGGAGVVTSVTSCEKSTLGCFVYDGEMNQTLLNWGILFLSMWPWIRYLRWSSFNSSDKEESESHIKLFHDHRATLPLVAVLSVGFFTQVFLWDTMALIKLPVSGISIVWANCLGMLLPVHLNALWWPEGYTVCSLFMTLLAVLAPTAGILYYSPIWLTTVAHVCAVVQGAILGIILGRTGKCWVRTGQTADGSPFAGALSSALHFLFVEKFSIWGIGASWLGVLDKLFLVLFGRMTGAQSVDHCIEELSTHMQNPWAGGVNCHFTLSYFPGIKVDVVEGSHSYIHEGTVWTQWRGVEWAPPVFFCMRYSIPLLCLLLYIHCFYKYFKDGAVSYRSGYYIHFTWSLQRSRMFQVLAKCLRINVFVCLLLLLLVGVAWVVEYVKNFSGGMSTTTVIKTYTLHIFILSWHYLSMTFGAVIFELISLLFCTWRLTAPVHMGWDISAMQKVVMRSRSGWAKLQDNSNIGKHLTEALWEAQRGDTYKLEQMIESPDPETVLRLCSRENTLTKSLLSAA